MYRALLRFSFLVSACLSLGFSSASFAQTRLPNEFQVIKITQNLITTPEFTYAGAGQYATDERGRWLEVEVEFSSAPEFTDELTFKYFILINGRLLAGEVTHVNIPAGRNNRSVMYVPPNALARFSSNRSVGGSNIQNIAVQMLQQGALKSELSLGRAPPQWYRTIPEVTGYVLNKNETPFAPLYWERYVQIKSR
jgi:hypothetical protein